MFELLEGVEETEEEIKRHMGRQDFGADGRYFQLALLVPDFARVKITDREVFSIRFAEYAGGL